MEHGPRYEHATSSREATETAPLNKVQRSEPAEMDQRNLARLKEKHAGAHATSHNESHSHASHASGGGHGHHHHPGFFGRSWGIMRGIFGVLFSHAWAGIKESAGAGFGGGGGGHKKSGGGHGGHGGGHH